MTEIDISPPPAWSRTSGTTQDSVADIEYEHEPVADTTFIVSLRPKINAKGYVLQFSTIARSRTTVRHDYRVDEFERVKAAERAAQTFMQTISQRVREGTISPDEPEIDAIQETIRSYR